MLIETARATAPARHLIVVAFKCARNTFGTGNNIINIRRYTYARAAVKSVYGRRRRRPLLAAQTANDIKPYNAYTYILYSWL